MASSNKVSSKRSKVTIACSACRKRRSKCSGSQPCDLCQQHLTLCLFDHQRIRRRGPRPQLSQRRGSISQQSASMPALRISSATSVNIPISAANLDYMTITAQPSTNTALQDDAIVAFAAENSYDSDSEHEYSDILLSDDWKEDLEILLRQDERMSLVPINFVLLLIHIFWQNAAISLRCIVDARAFFRDLKSRSASLSLCLALCVNSSRYCRHSVTEGPQGQNFVDVCQKVCRDLLELCHDQISITDIQAACVLSESLSSDGLGAQGWINLAKAKSLMQLARCDFKLQEDDELILHRINTYIRRRELFHAIGNPSLQDLRDEEEPALPISSFSHLFDKLLQLLVRVQAFCENPYTAHQPAPWNPFSLFRYFQERLEDYSLRHASDLTTDPESWDCSEEVSVLRTSCILIWHCCVMQLNRPFLSIPRLSPIQIEVIKESEGSYRFPLAPELFLDERIAACEISAIAICATCRELVARGHLAKNGALIGYAVFQSALILLNQLHCRATVGNDKLLEHIDVAFTILGAFQDLYNPARAWIHLLIQVRENRNLRAAEEESADERFRSFFARYVNAKDLGMIILWPVVSPRSIDPSPTDSPLEKSPSKAAGGSVKNTVASQDQSWARKYLKYLDEGSLGDEQHEIAALVSQSDRDDALELNIHCAQPSRSSITLSSAPPTQNEIISTDASMALDADLQNTLSTDSTADFMASAIRGELSNLSFAADGAWLNHVSDISETSPFVLT